MRSDQLAIKFSYSAQVIEMHSKFRFRSRSSLNQALSKVWSSSDQVLIKFRSSSDQVEIKLRSSWDQVEIKLRSSWDQVPIKLRSSCTQVEIKLRSSWDQVEIKLRASWEQVEIKLRASWEVEIMHWIRQKNVENMKHLSSNTPQHKKNNVAGVVLTSADKCWETHTKYLHELAVIAPCWSFLKCPSPPGHLQINTLWTNTKVPGTPKYFVRGICPRTSGLRRGDWFGLHRSWPLKIAFVRVHQKYDRLVKWPIRLQKYQYLSQLHATDNTIQELIRHVIYLIW